MRDKAATGTRLALFTLRCMHAAAKAKVVGLLEHPEDLGATSAYPLAPPASIWQEEKVGLVLSFPGWNTGAFLQRPWASYYKPTRFLTDLEFDEHIHWGRPKFDNSFNYEGPLPKADWEEGSVALVGRSEQGFNTTGTAAWPPGMCSWVASAIAKRFQESPEVGHSAAVPEGRGLQVSSRRKKRVLPTTPARSAQPLSEGGPEDEKLQIPPPLVEKGSDGEDGEATSEEEADGNWRAPKGYGWHGHGPPLEVRRKHRRDEFHEGGGLPSPGRWPLARRKLPDGSKAREIRSIISEGLKEALDGVDKRRLVCAMACQKCEGSPLLLRRWLRRGPG